MPRTCTICYNEAENAQKNKSKDSNCSSGKVGGILSLEMTTKKPIANGFFMRAKYQGWGN